MPSEGTLCTSAEVHWMKNKYTTDGEVVHIAITRQSGDVYTVTIDAADLDIVDAYPSWHVLIPNRSRRTYVQSTCREEPGGKPYYQLLHRALMGLEPGDEGEVTFLDGDPLNCRRANLHVTTHLQIMNTIPSYRDNGATGHRNISYYKRDNRYVVATSIMRKVYRRYFDALAEAVAWRDALLAEHGMRIEGKMRVAAK